MPETANRVVTRTQQDVVTTTSALLLDIVRTVVDQPNRVSLKTVAKGETTLFVLTVTARDLSVMLGLQGRTLQSLRTILDAVSKRNGQRFQVDIESERPTP
jgi:predicted RNA-binding protein YlqC (UPF0109 family)